MVSPNKHRAALFCSCLGRILSSSVACAAEYQWGAVSEQGHPPCPCRGHSFFSTNADLLERYAACPSSLAVIEVQTSFLEQLQNAQPKAPDGKYVSIFCVMSCVTAQVGNFSLSCLQLTVTT